MGLLELLIVVFLLLWLFGYFGRGRFYGSRGCGPMAGGSWVHTLLVVVVILIVLRLLGVQL